MKSLPVFATLAALGLGTLAVADSHADLDPAVNARQSHMQLFGHNLGILGDMAQGKTDYDADLAQIAAENLAVLASMDQTTYWPEGTAEGTKALPAIWENMDDFMAKQDQLAEAADAMAAAAGTDLASLQGAMQGVGGACSACHREYRSR